MTVLITSDLHLNDNPRDAYRHNFVSRILLDLMKKHQADLLLILGDFCDEKDHHGAWLVNEVVNHLKRLARICPVVCLKGNHDYIQADNPFFGFLDNIPNITWYNKPFVRMTTNGRPHKSLFLPHTNNHERDWKGLDFSDYDWFFAHQTFTGAAVGPRKFEGIDPKIFPHDADVISGDIHQPQSFENVTYCGSPFTVDFGDNFRPRVLLIPDMEKTLIKSIPCPGPQKRLVEIGSLKDLDKQDDLNSGDILKVRVSLNHADHDKWPAMKAAVQKWGQDNSFQIYLVQPQISVGGSIKTKRKIETQSDEALLKTYAGMRAIGEETLQAGMDLMREK